MGKFIDLTGQTFNRLKVISRANVLLSGKPAWNCMCQCGKKVTVRGADLRMNKHRSCGCLHMDSITTHGSAGKHGQPETRSTAYSSWMCIKARCLIESNTNYKWYGGKGVTIHPAWAESFTEFLDYIGEPPSKFHTVDRFPNKEGNYEPGNVRWATRKEQANNRKTNRILTYRGKSQPVIQWCRELGIPEARLRGRLRLGWSDSEAIEGR